MASDVEEIELRLTTSGGKTVSTTLSGVQEELDDVAQSGQEAGQEGSEGLDRMGDAAQETASDVDRVAEEAEQAASSTSRLGGSSGNASELLFSLGDTAQDAQYGLQGMGNNIGFAAEQASLMVQQAGSGKQAINQLSSAIVGPAGAVLAIQALIALGPKIMDFFQGSREATAQWKEELEDAAGDMFQISEEVQSFEAATLDQAKQVRDQLQTERDEIQSNVEDLERLVGLTSDIPEVRESVRQQIAEDQATGEEQRTVEQIKRDVRERLNLENASQETIEERLQDEQDRLQVTKQAVSAVESEVGSLKAAKQLSEAYAQTTADRAETEEDAAESLTEQAQRMEDLKAASLELATTVGEELQRAREEYQRGEEIQRSINIRQQRQGEGPLEGQIGPDTIEAPELSAEDFQTETVRQINSAIGVLQRRMDSVDSSNMRSQIQATIGDLEGMKREMLKSSNASQQFNRAIETGIESAIQSAAQAAAEGESIFAAIADTLGTLLIRLGRIAIATAIGIEGIRSALSSLNPVVAAAAGAALIAFGTAIKSQVADLATPDNSGSSSQPRTTRPDVEGGGEMTAGVDVPGFRHGVDDFSGGLAEVHRNEIVALPPASNVLTNENASAIRGAMSVLSSRTAGSGARQIQGEMEGRLDLNVTGPDEFELLETVNRLKAKLEETT